MLRVAIQGGAEADSARIASALAAGGIRVATADMPYDLLLTLGRMAATRLVVGDLAIDLAARRVIRDGSPVCLTPIEFTLLVQLARASGPLGRRALLGAVWGCAFDPGTNRVAVHVARLRAKLGRGLIVSEAGGYVLRS